MSNTMLKRAFAICATLALLTPVGAFAAAGTAIFVYGSATVVNASGAKAALNKGDAVDSGDTVITAANGRVQLQMADGGLLALRPGTEFLIEKFNYPAAGAVRDRASGDTEPASFFALLKGGFRSITGAIGKADKSDYRVRTPVATIGIRGTDYDAIYCAADCATLSGVLKRTLRDGLYVGVTSGGVTVTNPAGSVDLNAGEFGFAASDRSMPQRSNEARAVLAPATAAAVNAAADEDSTAAETAPREAVVEQPLSATNATGSDVDITDGGTAVADPSGALAVANLPGVGGGNVAGGAAALSRDAAGNVTGFTSGSVAVDSGSSQIVNVGRDTGRVGATGLSWGRWEGGVINVTDAGQTTQVPVDGSVHWVVGQDDAPTPVLPSGGVANFDLVGNTDPTDNAGNIGTLGSATLSADFDAETVDTDVSLSFAQTNQVWDASAQDVPMNAADATFAGAFDSVTVDDGSGTVNGSGELDGFFTGDDAGDLTGAGMSYSLSDDAGTDVAGSAAFQVQPTGP